jgi:NitT/TauT family transport system substrate-binding protein
MKKYALFVTVILALLVAACQPAATEAPAPTEAPAATEAPAEPTDAPEPTDEPEPTEAPATEAPAEPTPYPADEVSIGFGGTIPLTHPGVYVPQVLGFWEEENLTVNVQPNDGSGQSIQLLTAGQVEFAQVSPEPAIIAAGQGQDIVAIFTVNSFSSLLCALADSEYESVADFAGTRIGVPSATSSQIPFVKAMLTSAGLNADTDAELVPTGFGPAAAEALERGDVAAIGYWGGYYIETEQMGFSYKCFGLPGMEQAPGHVVVTMRETIETRPDLVERFGRAYAKAVQFASTHPEGTVRAYWQAYPESKATDQDEATLLANSTAVVDKSLDQFFWDYEGWQLGFNSPEGWQAMIDYMVDSGQVEGDPPSVENMITNDFVDAYNQFDPDEINALPDPE